MNTTSISLIFALAFMVGRFGATIFPPAKVWVECIAFLGLWIISAALMDAVQNANEDTTKKKKSEENPNYFN